MALNPNAKYPGQTAGTSVGYPYGEARNQLSPDDGTGTPLEEAWVNDLWGWQQALLQFAGITPSGSADEAGTSDYLDALTTIFPNIKDGGTYTPAAKVIVNGAGIETNDLDATDADVTGTLTAATLDATTATCTTLSGTTATYATVNATNVNATDVVATGTLDVTGLSTVSDVSASGSVVAANLQATAALVAAAGTFSQRLAFANNGHLGFRLTKIPALLADKTIAVGIDAGADYYGQAFSFEGSSGAVRNLQIIGTVQDGDFLIIRTNGVTSDTNLLRTDGTQIGTLDSQDFVICMVIDGHWDVMFHANSSAGMLFDGTGS